VPKPYTGSLGGGGIILWQPPEETCNSAEIPVYTEVTNWIIFLTFPSPIAAKEVTIDAHGAPLPKWETNNLSNYNAYIYFHGDLTRMVVDFRVAN
jgi:hypothetical protein